MLIIEMILHDFHSYTQILTVISLVLTPISPIPTLILHIPIIPLILFQLLQIAAIPVIMSLKTASLGSHIDFIVASSSSEGYVFTTFFVTNDFFSLPSATV